MSHGSEGAGRRGPLTRREVLAMAGGAFVVACFSERPTDPDGDGEATEVQMTSDLEFSPEHVTIAAGETIRWRNTSSFAHTATCDPAKADDPDNAERPEGSPAWDSGTVTANGTFSRRFDVPGEYRYFCEPHESLGMVGRITVTA